MGLFSRNEPASSGRRSSLSSEAQASELRGRARRRLIGALALVVAAVIVVPMLLDTSVPSDQASTPAVVPVIVPPAPEPGGLQAGAAPNADIADASSPMAAEPAPEATGALTEPLPGVSSQTGPAGPVETKRPPEPPPKLTEKAHEPKPEPKPEPKGKIAQRTDDGSVAIALLEGRAPSKAVAQPKAASGNFILQIASYTSDHDAKTRQSRLAAAGVTNAYVETAEIGGKTAYRLRVGPFPSREAAQAAQTRLRALGYDNGFISTK